MAETIFGKIIAGQIPCHKVYEDERVLAFLDINPLTRGHTLVVPKEPAETLDQLSDESAAALGRVLPRICRAVMAATGVSQYNVLENNGGKATERDAANGDGMTLEPALNDKGITRWTGIEYEGHSTKKASDRKEAIAKLDADLTHPHPSPHPARPAPPRSAPQPGAATCGPGPGPDRPARPGRAPARADAMGIPNWVADFIGRAVGAVRSRHLEVQRVTQTESAVRPKETTCSWGTTLSIGSRLSSATRQRWQSFAQNRWTGSRHRS